MENVSLDFLKSAFTIENPFNSVDDIQRWVFNENQKVSVSIKKIALAELTDWYFNDDFESLVHKSGNFFTIDGLKVRTNYGEVKEWSQPIINQPEIGYLGFIVKEFNGVLHFLMQAKIEPGNVNSVQLSPTLQATKSNYTTVHGGNKPDYLEYFQNATDENILLDQLQSEQGARFYQKRNRNIIVKVEGDIEVKSNFIWATLAQIKILMQSDNLVNMDTRTVIACIPFGSYENATLSLLHALQNKINTDSIEYKMLVSALTSNGSVSSLDYLIRIITKLKCKYELMIQKIPLDRISNWQITNDEIVHVDKKYFKVIAVEVAISNREVKQWKQPMIEPAQAGLCAFICKEINGIVHFIVQAKLECGNFDIVELAPTVQCLTGNYNNQVSKKMLPFLEYVLNVPPAQKMIDTLQSEEGGRFYKEQNRNLIVLAEPTFSEVLPENYMWMTLNQMHSFIKFNNYLNIQARSLIAALHFVK